MVAALPNFRSSTKALSVRQDFEIVPSSGSSLAVYLLEKRWALLRNAWGSRKAMEMHEDGGGIFQDRYYRVFNLDFDLRAKEERICVYDRGVED